MTATAVAPAPEAPLSHRQVMIVFSGLMLGMLLAALDQTIVATALPTIVASLHGEEHLSWVVSAYLLTSTVSTPLYGKVSDLVGRKGVFQFAIVVFLVGSALSGLAQSMTQLIVFRAVQGLGAGGLIALAMAIVGDIVSPRQRGRYQGYFGAVFAVASIMGPLAGGLFTEHLSWRWVFYVNLPLGAVALAVTSSVLRLPFRRQPHRIDYLGALLLVAGASSLLLVMVWGGSQYAWSSPVIIGLAVGGAVFVAVFSWWERRASEPLLPPRLFRIDIFNVSGGISFLQAMGMFGAVIFLPFYLQIAHGVSPTVSGLLLTPLMGGMLVMSIASGRLVSRTGRYRVFPIAGTFVMVIGMALLTLLGAHTSYVILSVDLALLGAGMGLVMQNTVLATQNAVDTRDMGSATSALTFFRSLGGVFGTAFFGAIFVNRLNTWLPRLLPAGVRGSTHVKATAGGFNVSPQVINSLPVAVRNAITGAMVHAMDTLFMVAVPIAVLTFVLALFLRETRLRESSGLFDNEVVPEPAAGVELDEPSAPGARARASARSEAPEHIST